MRSPGGVAEELQGTRRCLQPRGSTLKAIILLGTLKRSGLSHTEALSEFLAARMARAEIRCETIKLADYEIPAGTMSDMGAGDQWPGILEKVLDTDILVFATPIWWGGHSSLTQRAIERLDELHDHLLAGKPSGLEGKVGGVVITGDSDGAQHVIGNVFNFFNAMGLVIPPFASLSVLWDRQAKNTDATREALMRKYESDYADAAEKMIQQLVAHAGVERSL